MSSLSQLYPVQKTLTFELKSQWENKSAPQDSIYFPQTETWKQSLFENQDEHINERTEINTLLTITSRVIHTLDKLGTTFSSEPLHLPLEVDKNFVEVIDRNIYHQYKNRSFKLHKTNPKTKKTYSIDRRLKDSGNSLDDITAILGARNITNHFEHLAAQLSSYHQKVKADYEIKFGSGQHNFSGKSTYYGNILLLLQHLARAETLLNYIHSSTKHTSDLKEADQKLLNQIEEAKETLQDNQDLRGALHNFAQNSSKKDIELTTLNFRAVNKDPRKIQQQIEEVEQLEQDIESLQKELKGLNADKDTIVKELEHVLIKTLPELSLLDTQTREGQYVQNVIQKYQEQGKQALSDEEWSLRQNHQFQKSILKYIKFQEKVPSNKKDFINYGKSGEKLKHPKKVQTIKYRAKEVGCWEDIKDPLNKYRDFCKEKWQKAQELGNKKQLYHSIKREVLRQKTCNHFSLLCTDGDTSSIPYFYLVLIPNQEKSKLHTVFNEITTSEGEWQYLEYHRLTFKALEKLALLESATFEIEDKDLNEQAKSIWKKYKTNSYKDYQGKELKNIKDKNAREVKKKKLEKQELTTIINYCIRCIKSLPGSDMYNFTFKSPDQYESLDEFAKDVDDQGYVAQWKSVNKDRISELEQEGLLKVLKIHNKDFRKVSSPSKPNLFTLYWLNAMNTEKTLTRILPEIDIFARPKEKDYASLCSKEDSQGKSVKAHKRKSEDKLYASFKVEFYPEANDSQFEEINENVNDMFTKKEKTYFLGLDRGENELVTWCLIDDKGQLIKKGDWTKFQNPDGEDVDFSKKLAYFYKDLDSDSSNTERNTARLNAQKFIKEGYCGYLIGEINSILEEYPNTYLVLEDLDMQGKAENGETNKEKQTNLKMGAIVYQTVENALVNKFKYHTTKDQTFEGRQTVPDVVRVEDLREVEKPNKQHQPAGKTKYIQSKAQVGNILFVDEYLTSDECPNCRFSKEQIDEAENITYTEFDGYLALSTTHHTFTLPKHMFRNEGNNIKEDIDNGKLWQAKTDEGMPPLYNLFVIRGKKNAYLKKKYTKGDYVFCPKCQFSTENCNSTQLQNENYIIQSGDDVAAYNIAIRGRDYISQNNT